MPGPLHNVRVIDLTTMLSGPWATMMLAEQGAPTSSKLKYRKAATTCGR
jgi:hypothetical protein